MQEVDGIATTPYRTVLVDDVVEVVALLRAVLGAHDHFEVIAEAVDGVRALAEVANSQPDLILLDLSMPRMNGLDALPSLLEISPSSRVVILSGQGGDFDVEPALQAGAAGYLPKDLPPDQMIDRLLEIMSGPRPPAPPDVSTRLAVDSSGDTSVLQLSAEEMISLVAHEVRNHLAVIQGFGAELYGRWADIPDATRRDSVLRMTERARYLNTVVNNLMYMRRLESGHAWTEGTPTEVEMLLAKIHSELEDLARDHELTIEIEPGLPLVRADALRLRQVLTNLVVNAARYSPIGGAITLGARSDGEQVLIEVRDVGTGIAPGNADAIFEKFRRLEEGGAGIGLGLFISRELMRSMSGDLKLAEPSDQRPGATFICSLPLGH